LRERAWGWQTKDGLPVFAREWTPDKPAATQGVVLLVHGMGEHSGRYRHVAKSLADDAFAVLAFDQIGHGLTAGKRGHVRSYADLLDGIQRLLDQADRKFPDKPKFLFGHSMGGNLALNFLLRNKPLVTGAIVTGPWLKLAFEPTFVQVTLARLMEYLYPSFISNRPMNREHLTSDPRMQDLHQHDPLVHGYISAKFYQVVQRAGLWALEHAGLLAVPLLLMHGGSDRVTSAAASRQFAERAGTLCTYKEWPDFGHELHNELHREDVLAEIKSWIKTHLPKSG